MYGVVFSVHKIIKNLGKKTLNKMNMQRLENKLLREAKDWFKTDPETVRVIKKLKKTSPPDCDYIILNCLTEAFNRVHPECKIEIDITPRIIKKKIGTSITRAWAKKLLSIHKSAA